MRKIELLSTNSFSDDNVIFGVKVNDVPIYGTRTTKREDFETFPNKKKATHQFNYAYVSLTNEEMQEISNLIDKNLKGVN